MSRADAPAASLYHRVVVWLLFLILLLPLAGTLLYSLATSWSATILPDGLTFKWYLELWGEPRFLKAFGQSLLVCFGALALSVVLILPLLFVSNTFIRIEEGILVTVGGLFPVRPFAEMLQALWDPRLGTFEPLSLVWVAAWGVAGLLVASRTFTWEPRA